VPQTTPNDPMAFIRGVKPGYAITFVELEEECQITRREAQRAFVAAFGAGLVLPAFRQIGSSSGYRIHILTIGLLLDEQIKVEVAFIRS
jgi:hypothetical protein